MVSGLRQVVLALLTLSSDGCRSLHRHSMAAERGRSKSKMGERWREKQDKRRGVRREGESKGRETIHR